jgi:hypothetical protein
MSFGFYRTPSPAQKARRLTNLRIDEVSAVDRGAGQGVDIVFTKRQGRTTMQTQTVGAGEFRIAEAAFEKAQRGEISEFDLNFVMQSFAKVYHSGDMDAFLQTELGKVFLRPRQFRKSVAEETDLLAKAMPRQGQVTVTGDEDDTARRIMTSAHLNTAQKTDAAIQHFMSRGLTRDQAATKVLRWQRQEDAASPETDNHNGDHDADNRRGMRTMTSASSLNDDAAEAVDTDEAIKQLVAKGLSRDEAATIILRQQRGY